jgi:hypothetical protein
MKECRKPREHTSGGEKGAKLILSLEALSHNAGINPP